MHFLEIEIVRRALSVMLSHISQIKITYLLHLNYLYFHPNYLLVEEKGHLMLIQLVCADLYLKIIIFNDDHEFNPLQTKGPIIYFSLKK